METATKPINLEKVGLLCNLLMHNNEDYEGTTVLFDTASGPIGGSYRIAHIKTHYCEVHVSEDGGVTWRGVINWDLLDIIKCAMRDH
jgi:hypothetical protein